jgi:sugar lactone lactonase YvrE
MQAFAFVHACRFTALGQRHHRQALAGRGGAAGNRAQRQAMHECGKRCTNMAFGGGDGRTCYVTLADQGTVERFRVDLPGRSWRRVG